MTTASEALAGGAPPPAAGDSPAAGGAGAAAPPPAAAGGQPSGIPWLEGADPDTVAYVQNKGFKDPRDTVTAYRNLEKLLGADKAGRGIVLPKDENDAEGWSALWGKLGRPDKPEGYGLEQVQGIDPDVSKEAAELFHKLGVPGKQAKAIAEWWIGRSQQAAEQEAGAARERGERELGELKSAWGAKYDANLELARRGARALGYDHETLARVEDAIGPRRLMELMHRLGAGSAEDAGTPRTEAAGQFALAPAQAQAEIKRLGSDREFMAKLDQREPAALEKWAGLHKAAYPE